MQIFIPALEHFIKTITCLFFVVLVASSFSQVNKQSKFGLVVGLAYNTQVQDSNKIGPVSPSFNNRFSPYAGFMYRDSINKWLTLITKLYYAQRGVQYIFNFDSPTYFLHSRQIFVCHYISFPINLRFNYKKFFIGAGVEGSILIKGLYDSDVTFGDPSTGYSYHTKLKHYYGGQYFQPVDAGFSCSLGYRFKHFEIEGSMFHGLIAPPKFNIFTIEHFNFNYLYQQTFMLGINYFPTFKKRNTATKKP